MARSARPAPRTFSSDWPDEKCTEPAAEAARQFALRLREFTTRDGTRAVARKSGVSHSAVSRIVNGETWADIGTLARLEAGLGTTLWHFDGGRKPMSKPSRSARN